MIRIISSILLSCGFLHAGDEVKLLKLPPTAEMSRGELYVWKPSGRIDAIMVFCPGHNGSGEGFASSDVWQKFAETNGIGLCGLSFAYQYTFAERERGYSYAARGSGKLLLEGLIHEFGKKELPLFFYGYSAGARFTTSFLAWKPERVDGWCASGVGTWPPFPQSLPSVAPGIVACGGFDAACYWKFPALLPERAGERRPLGVGFPERPRPRLLCHTRSVCRSVFRPQPQIEGRPEGFEQDCRAFRHCNGAPSRSRHLGRFANLLRFVSA